MTRANTEGDFWAKVDRNGPIPPHRPDLGRCWMWVGSVNTSGYAYIRWHGRRVLAHRLAYELLVGLIPLDLALDHLCRQRPCVNPKHLEPVTWRENTLRGDTNAGRNAKKLECPQGHPYDAENTYLDRAGRRHCRACGRERFRERYRSLK